MSSIATSRVATILAPPSTRTPARRVEVAWFFSLCSDGYEFLGVQDGRLRSSFEHSGEIVRRAGGVAGQDPMAFVLALAVQTRQALAKLNRSTQRRNFLAKNCRGAGLLRPALRRQLS